MDAGIAGIRVTDLPVTDDCAKESTHPLHHTVTVSYSPSRKPCITPQFVRVRAILSWDVQPPVGTPGYAPVWGSVLECDVQIAPAPWITLPDLVGPDELPDLPEGLGGLVEQPIDVPEPTKPSLPMLAERGHEQGVEPHRFAMTQALAVTSGDVINTDDVQAGVDEFNHAGLELGDVLEGIEQTNGDVSYEELECVGLDDNRERLVGTFRIKRPTGFSGGLCSAGSTEYVAFWVDWGDTCTWTYAGTAQVAAHDFPNLPDEGLCYSAALPVSLEELRRDCEEPRIARIRAVLSWDTPPSTTDPTALPVWGNRVDTHVRVLPGVPGGDPSQPETWITLVGGVNVSNRPTTSGIDLSTGKTTDDAVFAHVGVPTRAGRPFGGWIVVHGPSLAGRQYKVEKKRKSDAIWTPMTDEFWVVDINGTSSRVEPRADGTVDYRPKHQNFTNILGRFRPGDDDLWEIRLVVIGLGTGPTYRVQLDNTPPDVDLAITSGAGTCGTFSIGATVSGTLEVADPHLHRWSLNVPNPDPNDEVPGSKPNDPNPRSGSHPVSPGSHWQLDTTGMKACGYNIELHARDDAILNSSPGSGNHAGTRVGFCLEE